MDGIIDEKEYVAFNTRSIEEKILAVEEVINVGEDKHTVRAVFKELKHFVRAEYGQFHKRKYFGTYIFVHYHPLIEEIHIDALGDTRVNATISEIESAIADARDSFANWKEGLLIEN